MAENSTGRKRPCNILLDDEESTMLTEIAEKGHTTRSAVVRSSIRARHAMDFDNVPTCATDSRCMCPQMFPATPRG